MKRYILLVLLVLVCTKSQANHRKVVKNRSDQSKLSTPLECARKCADNEPPKICYYNFVVELYTTMGRACDVCTPFSNNSLTNQCQCVLADGVERSIITANRQIPGPSIQVCKNDKVIIDVKNLVEGNEITIHWHGIFQQGSQYSDGVPFVTQCPIQEGSTFRYQWIARNAGTHFWHAHSGLHKSNGLSGNIIIRESPRDNIHASLYDFDQIDHYIELNDWMPQLMEELYPGHTDYKPGQNPNSILINGRGQTISPVNQQVTNISLEVFKIASKGRYRFRLINAFATVCGAMLTIENHSLTVIATDGEPVKPVKVSSIVSFSGERYDFIINADQDSGAYWIQVRGIGECSSTQIQQLAILTYSSNLQKPNTPKPTYSKGLISGFTLNAMDDTCDGKNRNGICVNQLVNAKPVPKMICQSEPATKIDVGFRFKNYTDPKNFFQPNVYKPFFVTIDRELFISLINNITFQYPKSPLISQRKDINSENICNATFRPSSCQNDDCHCTQVVEVPKNSFVELFIVDQRGFANLNHPFHLHGYSFYVISMGTLPENGTISLEYFHQLDRQKKISRCPNPLPPKKDTIQIPKNGYAIVRFVADNPGYWFLHCHFLVHIASGMNMVLHVAGDLPPVPKNFPKCGDFTNEINLNPNVI